MSVLEAPVQPRPEFAEQLWGRLVAEIDRPAGRLAGRTVRRTLLLAATLVLVLAGVATATYLGVRLLAADRPTQPAQLTAISGSRIVALSPSGAHVIWQCPRRVFCGDLVSLDWSRDGRRVAFTLGELGGTSAYIGLHIVDIGTGRDLHLPRFRLADPLRVHQPASVLRREYKAAAAQLVCYPGDVAWSPSGQRLAYGCPWTSGVGPALSRGVLFTIGAEGRNRQKVRTGTDAAYSPSWSPDGSRIAFATGTRPTEVIAFRPTVVRHSSVYIVAVHGGQRMLLAHDAAAPDWSSTGQAIAYETRHGVRIATPNGRDITPHTLPQGITSWSPDGTRLAISTAHGVYVYGTHDWRPHLLTRTSLGGVFGTGRPAWYAGRFAPHVRSLQGGRLCAVCF